MNSGVMRQKMTTKRYLQEVCFSLLPTTDFCVGPFFALNFFLEVAAPMFLFFFMGLPKKNTVEEEKLIIKNTSRLTAN